MEGEEPAAKRAKVSSEAGSSSSNKQVLVSADQLSTETASRVSHLLKEVDASEMHHFQEELRWLRAQVEAMCLRTEGLVNGQLDTVASRYRQLVKELQEQLSAKGEQMADALDAMDKQAAQLAEKPAGGCVQQRRRRGGSAAEAASEELCRCASVVRKLLRRVDAQASELSEAQQRKRRQLNDALDAFFKERAAELNRLQRVWAKEYKRRVAPLEEAFLHDYAQKLQDQMRTFVSRVSEEIRFPARVVDTQLQMADQLYRIQTTKMEESMRKTADACMSDFSALVSDFHASIGAGVDALVREYKDRQVQRLFPVIPLWRDTMQALHPILQDVQRIHDAYCNRLGPVTILADKPHTLFAKTDTPPPKKEHFEQE